MQRAPKAWESLASKRVSSWIEVPKVEAVPVVASGEGEGAAKVEKKGSAKASKAWVMKHRIIPTYLEVDFERGALCRLHRPKDGEVVFPEESALTLMSIA